MINLFSHLINSPSQRSSDRPILPNLDSSLYPLYWQVRGDNGIDDDHLVQSLGDSQMVDSANALLMALVTGEIVMDAQEFWQIIQANDIYQDWVNFTVFGRYVQRSFAAFYRQSEDNFNSGMPELLRYELLRHAQYLPQKQALFFAGKLPAQVRQEKLATLTLNPCTMLKDAIEARQVTGANAVIVNQVLTTSDKVTAFAVRHNKRTSERLRCEVMVLDFQELRLVKEQEIDDVSLYHGHPDNCPVVLRHYQLR